MNKESSFEITYAHSSFPWDFSLLTYEMESTSLHEDFVFSFDSICVDYIIISYVKKGD